MRQTTLLLLALTIFAAISTVAKADEYATSALIARFINRLGERSREEELKKYSDEVLAKELAQLNIPLYNKKASAQQMTWTTLHKAILRGNMNDVKWLVWSGADVNKPDGNHTPLHQASYHGQLYAAKLLIARGANIDLATDLGATPLHWACLKAHLDIAELLLKNGADKNKSTSEGSMPLEWVPSDKKEKFKQLFAKY